MLAAKPEFTPDGNDVVVTVRVSPGEVPKLKANGKVETDADGNPVMVPEVLDDLIAVSESAIRAIRQGVRDERQVREAPAIIAEKQALVGKKVLEMKE